MDLRNQELRKDVKGKVAEKVVDIVEDRVKAIQRQEMANKTEIMELYTVFDLLADTCGPVFEARNQAVAERQFKRLLTESFQPEDFLLVRVGYVERSTGQCVLIPEQEIVLLDDIEGEKNEQQ